jgi:plasmid stability protein
MATDQFDAHMVRAAAILRDAEAEVRDNVLNSIETIERAVGNGSIAQRRRGLPVSGDAIAKYWAPIALARKAALRHPQIS